MKPTLLIVETHIDRETIQGDTYSQEPLYELWRVTEDGMTYLHHLYSNELDNTIQTYKDMGYSIVMDLLG